MDLRIQCICVDADDPRALGRWWSELLRWRVTGEEDDEVLLEPPAGSRVSGASPGLLFLKTPDGKAGKNRLHLDLRPADQAAEVARAEAMGATRTDVGQGADVSWVVLADPEGNEFCILRALTEDELAAEESGEVQEVIGEVTGPLP